MAGIVGFEPTDAGFRVRSLTTWRYPKIRESETDSIESEDFCKFIFLKGLQSYKTSRKDSRNRFYSSSPAYRQSIYFSWQVHMDRHFYALGVPFIGRSHRESRLGFPHLPRFLSHQKESSQYTHPLHKAIIIRRKSSKDLLDTHPRRSLRERVRSST